MSPTTAKTLGVVTEDLVRIESSGRSLELPVSVLPGMSDGVIALTLGYGRAQAGRIGSGVGFDAFTVRNSKAPGFDSGVTVTKVGRRYPLSATQEHGSMEGRPIRGSPLTELRSKAPAENAAPAAEEGGKPSALGVFPEHTPHYSLWTPHTYDRGHQWGMTIDLNSCIGCNACMTA